MPKPTRLTKMVRKMTRSGRVTYDAPFPARGPRLSLAGGLSRFATRSPGLVNEPGHARQLVELDLRHMIRVGVVVRVQARCEEDDRDALDRVAVVIAPEVELLEIGRVVHLVVERQRLRKRLVRLPADLVQFAADAIGADEVHRVGLARLVVAVPPDHVDVQLGHDPLERHRRVIGEVPRTQQTALFAGVPDEQQRPLRAADPSARSSRDRHQRHRPRTIIVGAVPDTIGGFAGRDASRRRRAAGCRCH